MKIKLMCREIEIIKINNALNEDADANSLLKENEIHIRSDAPFFVILHEICHFWIFLTARSELAKFNEEVVCDMYGMITEQLIIENDTDIIEQLWLFWQAK